MADSETRSVGARGELGLEAVGTPAKDGRADLQRLKWVDGLVRSRFFPRSIQILNLFIIVALVVAGWGVSGEASRYTNAASFTVWVVWWPVVVLLGLFAGRAWCAICHLRLIGETVGKWDLGVPVPRALKRYGPFSVVMLVGLFLLHSTVVSYGINHVASLTALYLLILVAYAAVVSLMFGPHAFCRHFCPLVPLLGSYARVSPVRLEVLDDGTCDSCSDKSCVRDCPNDLYLRKEDDGSACLLCLDCVKGCAERNLSLVARAPGPALRSASRAVTFVEAAAVVLLLGMLFEEVGEEWPAFEAFLVWVPARIESWGVPGEIFGSYHWLESLWMNIAAPSLLLLVASVASRLVARTGTVLGAFRTFAVALLPLVLCLHLVKMLHKFNSSGGFAKIAATAPRGLEAAEALEAGTLAAPEPLWVSGVLEGWLLLGLLALGATFSLYLLGFGRVDAKSVFGRRTRIAALPFVTVCVALTAVFSTTIVQWFGL